MKALLDSGISKRTRDALRDAGHDTVWVGDWEADPGDSAILTMANDESRVLVTLDKDFGELAIVRRMPHKGIVRLVDLSVKLQTSACLLVFENYGDVLQTGGLITVEPTRIRVRPPENPS